MKAILKNIPKPLEGKTIKRKEACKICHEETGIEVGEVDYWNIVNSKLVKCEQCALIQLDPMLTEEETSKGCLAYYIEESLRVSKKEQGRNLLRNFRRGFLFGTSLKRHGIQPRKVLELGPGSGYFSEGLKFVFPDAHITVMDINPEILAFNQSQHRYHTIENSLEHHLPEFDDQFDLIIARDILEHVIDISSVIKNVKKYMADNGVFHFITPNGHEDVWKHYLTFNHRKHRSELLINHVNYFDGKGLRGFLEENQFSALEYYTYKLKTTRRGSGWKISEKLMASVSQKKDADFYINEKLVEIKGVNFDKKSILNKWYINKKWKFLTYLISWYHHANIIRISPELKVGHEIYGLFRIKKERDRT